MIYIDKNSKELKSNNLCLKCSIVRHPKAKKGICQECTIDNNDKNAIARYSEDILKWGYQIESYHFNHLKNMVFQLITPCCGLSFSSTFGNIRKGMNSTGVLPCPKCGAERRMVECMAAYMKKHGRDYNIEVYEDYRTKVRLESEKNYRNFQDVINPDGVERGLVKWHLDHMVPIIQCFKYGVSVEKAGSVGNLQMLTSFDNISKHSKLDKKLLEKLLED